MELTPLGEHAFTEAFNDVQADAVATNFKCGFTEADELIDAFEAELNAERPDFAEKYGRCFRDFRNARAGLKLALMHGEISETLEAVRKNIGPDDHIPEYSAEEAELADAILRIMNYAANRKLHVAEALIAKNQYNRTREDHTRAVRASEHGKRF